MSESERQTDGDLIVELQKELRRLKEELPLAIAKRDRAAMVVETGDDSGHILVTALRAVRRLEERIEQVSELLAKEHSRS